MLIAASHQKDLRVTSRIKASEKKEDKTAKADEPQKNPIPQDSTITVSTANHDQNMPAKTISPTAVASSVIDLTFDEDEDENPVATTAPAEDAAAYLDDKYKQQAGALGGIM